MAGIEILRTVAFAAALIACAAQGAWANEPPVEEAAAEGAKEESEAPVAPGYLAVPVLNISVVKQNRVRGVLVVNLVLDIEQQDAMDAANGLLPRLADGYAGALAKWSNSFQSLREPANVVAIKNQLQQVTDQVLGRGDVRVLLQNALLKPGA